MERLSVADRYIEGHISPPSNYLAVGRGTDKAVELDLTSKIKYGTLLGARDVESIAVDVVERDYRGEIDLRDEGVTKSTSRELAIRRAIDFSLYAHKALNPIIHAKAVQTPWSVRLDDILAARGVKDVRIDFVGMRDIDEWVYGTFTKEPTGIAVRDLKTSGKSPSADACDSRHFIQLTSYAIGMQVEDGIMPERVQVDYLVDLKRGIEHKSVVGTRNDYDIAAVFNRLENLARAMQAGIFAPAPRDHWCCTQKWCGYYSTCPYVKNAKTIELRVPKPELYKIQPLVERTEHGNQQTPDDDCPECPEDDSNGDSTGAAPYLQPHGPELDATDD